MNLAEFQGDPWSKTVWGPTTVIGSSPNSVCLLQWAFYPNGIYVTLQLFPCWQVLAVTIEAGSVRFSRRKTPSLLGSEHLTQPEQSDLYDNLGRDSGEGFLTEGKERTRRSNPSYAPRSLLPLRICGIVQPFVTMGQVCLCPTWHHRNYWINPGITYIHIYRCSTPLKPLYLNTVLLEPQSLQTDSVK